jgi:hypothetical protein
MRIVRTSVALLGAFFVAAGILLGKYGQDQASGALVAFGLLYAAAGFVLTALSLRPNHRS